MARCCPRSTTTGRPTMSLASTASQPSVRRNAPGSPRQHGCECVVVPIAGSAVTHTDLSSTTWPGGAAAVVTPSIQSSVCSAARAPSRSSRPRSACSTSGSLCSPSARSTSSRSSVAAVRGGLPTRCPSRSRACSRSTGSSSNRHTRSTFGGRELARAGPLPRRRRRRQRARGACAPAGPRGAAAGARGGAAGRGGDVPPRGRARSRRARRHLRARPGFSASRMRGSTSAPRRRRSRTQSRSRSCRRPGRLGTLSMSSPGRPTSGWSRRLLPGARVAARDCARSRRARAECPRGGGTAGQRRDQDDASAGRLARPALAADRDRGRRGRAPASGAGARRARSGGAGGDDRHGVREARAHGGDLLDLSRLQTGAVDAVRELWSVDELVGAALDELHDQGTTAVDCPDRVAARRGRRRADAPRARQPARERAPAFAPAAGGPRQRGDV